MTTRKFVQPDRSSQSGATYRDNIDNSVAVVAEVAADWAPHAKDTPDLTILVDAGQLLSGTTLVSQNQQTVSGFVATGANQRIDRVVVDAVSGVASRVAGTESASPVAPAIPAGKLPVAQVGPFTTTTTQIGNGMITDERLLTLPPGIVSGAIGHVINPLTFNASQQWDMSPSNIHKLTLTGNITTFNDATGKKDGSYILHLLQDDTGSRTITGWHANYLHVGGIDPVLSTAPNARDVLSVTVDGSAVLCSFMKGMA